MADILIYTYESKNAPEAHRWTASIWAVGGSHKYERMPVYICGRTEEEAKANARKHWDDALEALKKREGYYSRLAEARKTKSKIKKVTVETDAIKVTKVPVSKVPETPKAAPAPFKGTVPGAPKAPPPFPGKALPPTGKPPVPFKPPIKKD